MSILLGVVLIFALLSATVAAMQAMAISKLAPSNSWRGWILGWWRFGEISQRAGLAGEEQAAIYKRAVIAAVTFVVLGLILSSWTVNQRSGATAHLAPTQPIGQRLQSVALNDNDFLRSVATMPGAIPVES